MTPEAQNQIERNLTIMLRNEINTALRAPGYEDVTVMDLRLVARRSEGMGGSAALESRLASNEKELDRLRDEAAAPTAKVTRMVPKIAESYRALVADLGNVALDDVDRARADLRRLYGGELRVRPSVKGDYLEAAVPSSDRLIELAVAGLGFTPSTSGVAGEGFEPSTFGL